MKLFLLLTSLFFIQTVFSQSIKRSVLSAQGNSTTLPSGIFISQTIGQQGVIGATGAGAYTIQQGYQQNLQSVYAPIVVVNQMDTEVYPKPFKGVVNFKFSEPITSQITVILHNANGNIVFQKIYPAPDKLLTVDFGELVPQSYVVQLFAKTYHFKSQLLAN